MCILTYTIFQNFQYPFNGTNYIKIHSSKTFDAKGNMCHYSKSESDLLHDMTKQLVFKSWDVCAHNNIIYNINNMRISYIRLLCKFRNILRWNSTGEKIRVERELK